MPGLCGPNTVHLPIRRRTAELGSPLSLSLFGDTHKPAKRYHAGPQCGNSYTARLDNYTHFQRLKLLRQSPDSVLQCDLPALSETARKARLPALRHDICTVCCATKRLVEIRCTEDCRYLESAQRHPAAVVKRQIDADVTVLMATIGRLSEQQLQLFFLLQSMVLSYQAGGTGPARPTPTSPLAAGALAGSLETASKGLIFEESTGSVVAEGLRRALKPVIDEVTKGGGSRAEREVAVVLRGIERGARHEGGHIPDGRDRRTSSSSAGCFSSVRRRRSSGSGATRPSSIVHAVIEFAVSRY